MLLAAKPYFGFHVNRPIFCLILTKSEIFSIDFQVQYQNFTKRRPVGVARTGERTNKTNPIGAYRDYMNTPKNHTSLWFPLVGILTLSETAASYKLSFCL